MTQSSISITQSIERSFLLDPLTENNAIYRDSLILKSFGNICYALGVFLDLTKAFGTVDHNILLRKLFPFGIRDNKLKILQSYLHNKKIIYCLPKY